jgi:hypothetical protein
MLITKTSMLSGNTSSMDIDVSQDQIDLWQGGSLIQDAMPNLSADEREFIMTGITPAEWGEDPCLDEDYQGREELSDVGHN